VFPRDFFVDYWNPSIRNEVFVAMPFAAQFTDTWERAIKPAVEDCGLGAFRVDTKAVSDSILVDILDGIAHCRLILCDVSPVSSVPARSVLTRLSSSHHQPRYPNGNVMYELGLAHAARQAEEVILVRNQTDDALLFDVSGVRVHHYEDDPEEARATIAGLIREALRSVEQMRGLQIRKAQQALTLTDLKLIRRWWPHPFTMWAKDPDGELTHIPNELNEASADLQRLGILRVGSMPTNRACAVNMVWTEFGNVLVRSLPASLLAGRIDPAEKARANAAAAEAQ